MKPSGLTLPGTLIRLLTPTQDLVFATERSRVTRSGGDFRDLTVFRAEGTGQARGSLSAASSALAGIPCNPSGKASRAFGAPRIT